VSDTSSDASLDAVALAVSAKAAVAVAGVAARTTDMVFAYGLSLSAS
jgi:hypothetical protein